MDARVIFTQQELTAGIPLAGISGLNPSDPNWQLQFASTATQDQINQCNTDASNFDWSADYSDPNVNQFQLAVAADTNIPQLVKTMLGPYLAVIQTYNYFTAASVKSIWADLVSQYGSSWLDSNSQSLIQGYAASANMPLV